MDKTFKWKFPHKISVDAKLKLESFSPNKKTFAMLFRNKDRQIVALDNPAYLEIDKTDALFMALKDGLIVEISWDNNKYHADRIRFDKNVPNKIDTAQNTIIQMKNPLTLDKLLRILESGEVPRENLMEMREMNDGKPFRKYCNTVKNILLKYTVKEGANVIDIGSGAGGDLGKYKQIKPNKLFFVEPDEKHLQEMSERLNRERMRVDSREFANSVVPIKAGAEDTKIIRDGMRKSGFAEDITNINMMFSMTFFGTNEKLTDLVQTLNLLKNNGTFLSIYMDGDKTFELLKKNNGLIEGSYYKIEDLAPGRNKLEFNHKIRFSFKGVTVREEGQIEYLIPVNEFRKRFKEIPPGFSLLSSSLIDRPDNIKSNDTELTSSLNSQFELLNEEDKLLLSLYRFDIYKKSVYQEIEMKQQERQNELDSLDPDEQQEIKLVFQKPDETFYRIGVIGDGSCFVHALLFTVFKDAYTALSIPKRKKFVEVVRQQVADSIDIETWTTLGNGNVASLILQQEISNKLSQNDQLKFDNIVIKTQEETSQNPEDFLNTFLIKIDESFPKLNLFDEENGLVKRVYNKYISNLKNPLFWIENSYIECFSNFFDNINIIIVKDISRDVYQYAQYKPDSQSVMILNIDPKHFEALVYEKDEEISFMFTPEDELMQILFVSDIERPEITSVTVEVETPFQEDPFAIETKKVDIEPTEMENIDDVKSTIKDIVNDYFLFSNNKINFEII
jgi:hypothetical protein